MSVRFFKSRHLCLQTSGTSSHLPTSTGRIRRKARPEQPLPPGHHTHPDRQRRPTSPWLHGGSRDPASSLPHSQASLRSARALGHVRQPWGLGLGAGPSTPPAHQASPETAAASAHSHLLSTHTSPVGTEATSETGFVTPALLSQDGGNPMKASLILFCVKFIVSTLKDILMGKNFLFFFF